jgi:hypothetical protein
MSAVNTADPAAEARFHQIIANNWRANKRAVAGYGNPAAAQPPAPAATQPAAVLVADRWTGWSRDAWEHRVGQQAALLAHGDHNRNTVHGIRTEAAQHAANNQAASRQQLAALGPQTLALAGRLRDPRARYTALNLTHNATGNIRGHYTRTHGHNQAAAHHIHKHATNHRGHRQVVMPKGSGNPAKIAHQLLGMNARDLERMGIGMDPNVPTNVCCANFVTTMLKRAGLINFHSNLVTDVQHRLHASGWSVVDAAHAPPGAVAIINGGQHIELVHSNRNGHPQLIGSNNVNRDNSQRVSLNPAYGSVRYFVPPGR